MKQPEIYWTESHNETLTYETPREAVHDAIGRCYPDNYAITAVEYKRNQIDKPSLRHFIEDRLIDYLEEEYGNPEEETDVPIEINRAIDRLVDEIVEWWPVWRCERTGKKITKTVAEWKKTI